MFGEGTMGGDAKRSGLNKVHSLQCNHIPLRGQFIRACSDPYQIAIQAYFKEENPTLIKNVPYDRSPSFPRKWGPFRSPPDLVSLLYPYSCSLKRRIKYLMYSTAPVCHFLGILRYVRYLPTLSTLFLPQHSASNLECVVLGRN